MSRQEIKEILHKLDVRADILDKEALARTLSILINLVETLSEQNEKLKVENQKLRDENNRLKGEQGKPNIRGNKGGGKGKNFSSEKERKQRKEKKKKKSKEKRQTSQLIERKYVKSITPNCLLMLNSKAMSVSLCRKS